MKLPRFLAKRLAKEDALRAHNCILAYSYGSSIDAPQDLLKKIHSAALASAMMYGDAVGPDDPDARRYLRAVNARPEDIPRIMGFHYRQQEWDEFLSWWGP
jgi:hypothetical protein